MERPSGYLDVDLVVARRGDVLETRVLDSPAGETATLSAPWPSTHGDDKVVGDALFAALLPGEVRLRYQKSTDRALASGLGVRVVLRFEGGADELPWELLRDPDRFTFLGLDPWRAVVRCTEMSAREATTTSATPLRILLAVSTPDGTPAIDAAAEIMSIQSRLRPFSWGAAVEVVTLRTASLDLIRETLQAKDFHVFHYIGHGVHPAGGIGHLDLTAEDGTTVSSRSADEIAAILAASPSLRLAVLNCCDSAVSDGSDGSDPFAGTAAAFVRAGIPAVVAMRRAITDTAAVAFADEFYATLIESGGLVEPAVARGRAALLAADGPVSTEWSAVALHLGSSISADQARIPVPGLDRDVRFTVSHPAALRPTVWEPMLFFAHHGERITTESGVVVDQSAEVEDQVKAFFGGTPTATTATPSSQPLPRGAGLVVRPDVPDVQCSPAQAAVSWTGEIAQLTFLLRAGTERAGTTVDGHLRVFSGPLLVAEAPLTLAVGGAEPAPPQEHPVERFRRIFPCYAPEDGELVESVVAVAEALGDGYLSEIVAERRSGAPIDWMRSKIAEADSFQLFWSRNSMSSATCRSEWEEALAARGDSFVRPLYWEEPFPRSDGLPPPGLAALRFVRLPLPTATVSGSLWAVREPELDPGPSTGWNLPPVQAPGPAPAPWLPPPSAPAPSAPPPPAAPAPSLPAPDTMRGPGGAGRAPGHGPPRAAPGLVRAAGSGLGILTGLILTVTGVIGGTAMAAFPGDSGHRTYWWRIIIGVLLLVVSLIPLVRRRR